MNQLDTFILCEYKTDRLWVIVRAEIKNGCLEISGHDLSGTPKQYFGMSEFEYWYKFDEANTECLIALLAKEGGDIKNLLYENFSGLEGCEKLMAFCNANAVEYRYSSWHTD
ncbi:MAG: hypothetical protein LBD73_06565 [Deferribacteraceae bacterium]|jgi:hypothetical protein|nr:hypothetical protein [Deferribacteraceae bacterium]